MKTHDLLLGSELSVRILAEVTDAIIVTDLEHHILYWNRAAEQLYGPAAQEVLGHRLGSMCPALQAALRAHRLPESCLADGQAWTGELGLRLGNRLTVLKVSVSLIRDSQERVAGIVYVQRDITELRNLEAEVTRCRGMLAASDVEAAPETSSFIPSAQPSAAQTLPSRKPMKTVILWAEDNDDDVTLMARAWQKAQVDDQLIRVPTGAEVIEYLSGEGTYADRTRHPLPRMLVLDLGLPDVSGLELVRWVHEQPTFQSLPIVILTCSAAPRDIQQAACLHVKGYLAKPANAEEWLMKVRTLTSQCV